MPPKRKKPTAADRAKMQKKHKAMAVVSEPALPAGSLNLHGDFKSKKEEGPWEPPEGVSVPTFGGWNPYPKFPVEDFPLPDEEPPVSDAENWGWDNRNEVAFHRRTGALYSPGEGYAWWYELRKPMDERKFTEDPPGGVLYRPQVLPRGTVYQEGDLPFPPSDPKIYYPHQCF